MSAQSGAVVAAANVAAEVAGSTALVTDAERRKALPIIRSLGRAGVRVIAASRHRLPLGAFSRHCAGVRRHPDYRAEPEAFLDWLEALLQRERIDVLYPIEDVSLELCVRNPGRWSPFTRALLPSAEALERAYDKWETFRCARGLGMRVPDTHLPEGDEALRTLAREWRGEAVIKPRKSSGSRGLRYVAEPARLVDEYRAVARRHPRPIVQERLPARGQGIGVSVLLDAGQEPVAVFGHRRLREYPVSGGPSTLRESHRDEALIRSTLALLREMGLVGVAMVEFKLDAAGTPILIEVNPRFWGSLPLAIHAGVDFPLLYHRLCLGQAVEPVLDYPTGLVCRWLLPGDLLHFLRNPERFSLEPSFFRFREPGLAYDILSREDPLPMLGILVESLRKLVMRTD